jgi:flagellar assembly factor FliW
MIVHTRSFGDIEVNDEKIIIFNEGIPGFENLKQFIFIEEAHSQFHYLQSTQDGNVCFVITDPYYFKKDYTPTIKESYFEKLGGGDNQEFSLYSIITLKDNIESSTINLAGPLLIHVESRQGIQIIVEDEAYNTKHKIVDLLKERG